MNELRMNGMAAAERNLMLAREALVKPYWKSRPRLMRALARAEASHAWHKAAQWRRWQRDTEVSAGEYL